MIRKIHAYNQKQHHKHQSCIAEYSFKILKSLKKQLW